MSAPREAASVLRLGSHVFPGDRPLVMAVVNRTRDSFYDRGAYFEEDAALAAVAAAEAAGAEIVDIGGVPAGELTEDVDTDEEIARVAGFVALVKRRHPDLAISVDTWRHEVAEAVCEAGADLINDAWGGADQDTAAVAARWRVGLVCTHVGAQAPRTDPRNVSYQDVVAEAVRATVALAERAVALGVPRESVLIDPAHDFGKTTAHSLEVTRRLDEMVATGWPVLVAVSNKDFIGETLDVPVGERLLGTQAALGVCAWQGARVFRVHDVPEARTTLERVAAIRSR